MNWAAISFDWNQARSFLATAEEGSLSAAARALGLTQPTLSRQVAALEEALGVTLFERAGRSVTLTEAGGELLDHVRAMAAAANGAALAASGQAQAVEGVVRITASDMIAAHLLPPVLADLRDAAPNLTIDVVADNAVRDLLLREADIAIRHVRPEEPSLIARALSGDEGRFYATSAYLSAYGRPTCATIARHQIVGAFDRGLMLGYLRPLGLDLSEANFRLGSQSGNVAWEFARAGLGMTVMSDRVAAKFPEFEPALPELEPFVISNWLVTHRELRTSRRIRLVFDLLAERLFARRKD